MKSPKLAVCSSGGSDARRRRGQQAPLLRELLGLIAKEAHAMLPALEKSVEAVVSERAR